MRKRMATWEGQQKESRTCDGSVRREEWNGVGVTVAHPYYSD